MASPHYVIRGGLEGRERLRVLGRVMRPATLEFIKRAGIQAGSFCLDAGCGGGDVTLELARLVGPEGGVIGIDIDVEKIEVARTEAEAQQFSNVEFRVADVSKGELQELFDVVYCRFVLTHLPAPEEALAAMWRSLRPGGKLLVADIDCDGYFWYPASPAQSRFSQLYTEAVRRRGGDPCIGPRLPSLLVKAGFEGVHLNVVQPAGLEGEVKLIAALTMENIADTVLAQGLASSDEIQQIVADLYAFAHARETVGSLPRIVEVWGLRPPT